MNNTARLQGCAVRHEILVMDDAIAKLLASHAFDELRHTAVENVVENVVEPLRFRALA